MAFDKTLPEDEKTIVAQDSFTDPIFVPGSTNFIIIVSTTASTVSLERTVTADTSKFKTVKTPLDTNGNADKEPTGAWYRAGIATGGFTDNVTVSFERGTTDV